VRIVVAALILYYPLGALIIENIDDDPSLRRATQRLAKAAPWRPRPIS
jgi:hypothetical protein